MLLLLAGAATGALWGLDGLKPRSATRWDRPAGFGPALALLRSTRDAAVSRTAMAWPPRRVCLRAYAASHGADRSARAAVSRRPPSIRHRFCRRSGFPIQLFRALLALALAVCLWQYMIDAPQGSRPATLGRKRHSLYISPAGRGHCRHRHRRLGHDQRRRPTRQPRNRKGTSWPIRKASTDIEHFVIIGSSRSPSIGWWSSA